MRLFALGLAALTAPSIALAGTVTLSLQRTSLTNVTDAAGIWQMEGGELLYNGRDLGEYACTRRTITGGTTAQNTAMLTCTLFIAGSAPPQNLTIQGAHDYGSGRYIGSVSAASGSYAYLIGADASGNTATDALTLTW